MDPPTLLLLPSTPAPVNFLQHQCKGGRGKVVWLRSKYCFLKTRIAEIHSRRKKNRKILVSQGLKALGQLFKEESQCPGMHTCLSTFLVLSTLPWPHRSCLSASPASRLNSSTQESCDNVTQCDTCRFQGWACYFGSLVLSCQM